MVEAVISWLPFRKNKFTYYISKITGPILNPVRNLLMKSNMMRSIPVDISPVIVYFILALVARIIRRLAFYSFIG